ncbi:MAG: hypothetical protein H6917_04800 [Novosphingobium sp.]|nr:hypothetical protein [Novosphingobium sp.]MCP5401692.1 hypothetical protein [Novosphingobium sp.]
MIGKIVGAVAGSRIARRSREIDSPMGAVLGVAAATLVKRLSLPVLVTATAGGYFLKRHLDGRKDGTGVGKGNSQAPSAIVSSPG